MIFIQKCKKWLPGALFLLLAFLIQTKFLTLGHVEKNGLSLMCLIAAGLMIAMDIKQEEETKTYVDRGLIFSGSVACIGIILYLWIYPDDEKSIILWNAVFTSYIGVLITVIANMAFELSREFQAKRQHESQAGIRHNEIQPVFSVFICDDQSLGIQNNGLYPIRNVRLLNTMLPELQKTCGECRFVCYLNENNEITIANSKGMISNRPILPEKFKIAYEDIDGNKWYQEFKIDTHSNNYFLNSIYQAESK